MHRGRTVPSLAVKDGSVYFFRVGTDDETKRAISRQDLISTLYFFRYPEFFGRVQVYPPVQNQLPHSSRRCHPMMRCIHYLLGWAISGNLCVGDGTSKRHLEIHAIRTYVTRLRLITTWSYGKGRFQDLYLRQPVRRTNNSLLYNA